MNTKAQVTPSNSRPVPLMDDIDVLQLNTAYNELGKELSESRMRVIGQCYGISIRRR
jgi:hypothetical protein